MNYRDTIADIVKCSKNIHENYPGNISFEKVLDIYCRSAIRSHRDQLRRSCYNATTPANELLSEQIANSLFYSCVARDILEGHVSRPQIGNVRKVALDHYKALTAN